MKPGTTVSSTAVSKILKITSDLNTNTFNRVELRCFKRHLLDDANISNICE